jgi:ceramide glucosyltransferase
MIALFFLAGLSISVVAYALSLRALALQRGKTAAVEVAGFVPPISILKPLRGLDDCLEENLESYFRLDYPDFEIVFSFADDRDPAFAVARRVADRHAEREVVFVVDGREPGANAKVARLAAAFRRARGKYLLLSDGNVRVEPDFLRRAVGFFAEPSVGLVSHLFRAAGARTLASRMESLHLNGCLQAGTAAIAHWLGMPCVVGKSILVSRSALNAIGGFAPLRDFLAEDFLLGKLVSRAGFRVILCAEEVETAEVAKTFGLVWARHRRWAMLRQRFGGMAYLGEAFSSPAVWFAGTVLSSQGRVSVLAAAMGLGLARAALESIGAAEAGHPLTLTDYLILPIRDVWVSSLFWAGLFGRRTAWRGRPLTVGPGTLLLPEQTYTE